MLQHHQLAHTQEALQEAYKAAKEQEYASPDSPI